MRRYQNPDGTLTLLGKEHYSNNVVKKGSRIYRAASSENSNFMNRKYTYVNITPDFADHSTSTGEGFEGRFNVDFVMKAKKNLKIAGTGDYFYAVCEVMGIDPKERLTNTDIGDGKRIVQKLLEHEHIEGDGGQYKTMNKVVEHLSSKGYDGVKDPVDFYNNSNATIIFNPKECLEIEDIWER